MRKLSYVGENWPEVIRSFLVFAPTPRRLLSVKGMLKHGILKLFLFSVCIAKNLLKNNSDGIKNFPEEKHIDYRCEK